MYGVYDYVLVTHTCTRARARTHKHTLWQLAPASLFYLQQDYYRHVWDTDIVDQPTR